MHSYCSLGFSSTPSLNHLAVGNGLPSTIHFNSSFSPWQTSSAFSNFFTKDGATCSMDNLNLASVAPARLVATAAYYKKEFAFKCPINIWFFILLHFRH